MKHLITTLMLVFVTSIISAQSLFRAYVTEMYTYNKEKEDWDLYQKNSDVQIDIVVEDKFLSIQAKSPTMYKVYESTKQELNLKSFTGYRYEARDLKEDVMIKIDILKDKNSDWGMISIIHKENGYNLRYFVKSNN